MNTFFISILTATNQPHIVDLRTKSQYHTSYSHNRACAREGRKSACDSLPTPRTPPQPDRTLTARIPAIGSSVDRIYKAPWPLQTRTNCAD